VSSARPVRIFSTLGVENSSKVFLAIALEIGDELLLWLIRFWWWRVEWIRINPVIPCIKYKHRKTTGVNLPKQRCLVMISHFLKYLFTQFFSYSLFLPRQRCQKCLLPLLTPLKLSCHS
jgi:hypothetical protein